MPTFVFFLPVYLGSSLVAAPAWQFNIGWHSDLSIVHSSFPITQSWQNWHLIQMQRIAFKECEMIRFLSQNPTVYTLGFWERNEFFCTCNKIGRKINSFAFFEYCPAHMNIANFLYRGKTRVMHHISFTDHPLSTVLELNRILERYPYLCKYTDYLHMYNINEYLIFFYNNRQPFLYNWQCQKMFH